jgi:hypothetical protein
VPAQVSAVGRTARVDSVAAGVAAIVRSRSQAYWHDHSVGGCRRSSTVGSWQDGASVGYLLQAEQRGSTAGIAAQSLSMPFKEAEVDARRAQLRGRECRDSERVDCHL